MRKLVVLTLVVSFASAAQAEWHLLDDDGIRLALTDRRLQYPNATQQFYASGLTLYNAGQDSWGYWRAEGGQYCSQWPPSDLWACYDMQRSGQRVRFVGEQGDITVGVYVDD